MQKTLKIEGMMCEHCTKHVTEALEKIEGVEQAVVTLGKHKKPGEAVVTLQKEVDDQVLRDAVAAAGYTVVG